MISLPKALTCPDVVALLPKYQGGSLDSETQGRVEGHLLACEDCTVALAAVVDEAYDQGLIPYLAVPPMPVPAALSEPAGAPSALVGAGVIEGLSWETVKPWLSAPVAWFEPIAAKVREALTSVANSSPNPESLGVLKDVLAALGAPSTLVGLVRIAEHHKDPFLRGHACEAIGRLGDARAVNKLHQVAQNDPDTNTRLSASKAAGELVTRLRAQWLADRLANPSAFLADFRRRLQSLQASLDPAPVGLTLGYGTLGPNTIDVLYADAAGQITGEPIRFDPDAGDVEHTPVVTAKGVFRLVVSSDDPALAGRRLVAILRLIEGEVIRFEADLVQVTGSDRRRAEFRAEGLPSPGRDINIPWSQLDLVAIPAAVGARPGSPG